MALAHNSAVDVLFVNPPSPDGFVYIRDINRHGRSSWERIKWPQTSLAYLAAVANELGLTVDIVDCISEEIDWVKFKEIMKVCRPKYCFSNIISVTYSNDLKALSLSKELSSAITVGMGPHITNDPKQSLTESKDIDFVIRHEAEQTLSELLQYFENNQIYNIDNLKNIKGIAFVPDRISPGTGDEVIVTEQRPFIEDLDSLPRPRHDLLPLDQYWAPFLGHYTFIEASRGCPFRCVFCRQAVMWQWKFRRRSGAALAEEALYVHSLGIDNILFHADTFTLDTQMVHDLCDALIAAGTPFRWACNTHVSKLFERPELAKKMKDAGCWMIAVGIESGDNEVLRKIKKQITVEQAESLVRMLDETGSEPWGYFVLGLPGDTLETMNKTIDFALRLPLKMAKFDIAAPYPGTEFYRYAKDLGYLKLDSYEDFDQNASAIVEYPHLSRKQIKAAVRRATRRFYLQPRVFVKIMKEIKSLTTFKTLLLIVRDQFSLLTGLKRLRKDARMQAKRTSN
jgi:radical SAM superfamily enzyme YgiQ (UPF0313 family)